MNLLNMDEITRLIICPIIITEISRDLLGSLGVKSRWLQHMDRSRQHRLFKAKKDFYKLNIQRNKLCLTPCIMKDMGPLSLH